MKTNILSILFLLVSFTVFSQDTTRYKVINGEEIIYFDTKAEHDAWVADHSPTPDLTDYIKNAEHEELGKEVVRELYRALKNQNLTQAQEGDLLNRVFPVLSTLSHGFIRGAKAMANMLVVSGQLTQARKDFLIAKIDEAIAKL